MELDIRAIEYIKRSGEFLTTADGTQISASQMMERFLFSGDMQWSIISKLSGGERRRLYLLKILMTSPNVLILDEPTNDLDLNTLNVLEDYIEDFSGPVITVSHDRYFLDVVCNKIFSFEGEGQIVVNVGNYSDFTDKRDRLVENLLKANKSEPTKEIKKTEDTKSDRDKSQKPKFSYKEKREFESIDSDMAKIESQIDKIDAEMILHASDYTTLEELMEQKESLEQLLLEKLERQEYFSDLEDQIENHK